MVKRAKRTQKERIELKLVQRISESFYEWFRDDFDLKERIVFAIYDKLKQYKKFADVSYNNFEQAFQVDINPDLAKQKPDIITETGHRMALKMMLLINGEDPSETSDKYRKLSAIYHLWNYGPYAETPQKWHIYSCSKCNRKLLVYSSKLPDKSPIVNSKTIFHKKNSRSETEKPHQGRYAYSGVHELQNWELQELLHTMDVIKEKTDYGRNTDPTYYYVDPEDDW